MEALNSIPGEVALIETDDFIQGRVDGFKTGSCEYVSFCDDDDFINVDGVLLDSLLDSRPPAVYTNSIVLHQEFNRSHLLQRDHTWNFAEQLSGQITVHQLTIVHRSIAIECSEKAQAVMKGFQFNPFLFDLVFNLFVGKNYGWYFQDVNAYTWRQWSVNQGHKGLGPQVDVVRKLFRQGID